MTNLELKNQGRLTVEEYADMHNVETDVIASLVRIYDGIPAKKSDTGVWYIREKLPFKYSKEECEEIHIENINYKILKENNVNIRNPRIYGAPKAAEEYELLKDNGYSIFFDEDIRRLEVKSNTIGSGLNISDMLIKRHKEINQRTVLAIAQGQIERKIYNSFMIIGNGGAQYMLSPYLDEAIEKTKNLALKKENIYPIRIYSHGIKIEEYGSKEEVLDKINKLIEPINTEKPNKSKETISKLKRLLHNPSKSRERKCQ